MLIAKFNLNAETLFSLELIHISLLSEEILFRKINHS